MVFRCKKSIKYDFILIASILAFSIAIFAAMFFSQSNGEYVKVSVDGKETGVYYLSIDGEYVIGDGSNVLVIENGKAYISHATCPDGLCVRRGRISIVGESIICLPNKVTVTVVGKTDNSSVDIVS